MLRLNPARTAKTTCKCGIQIQPMLRLNRLFKSSFRNFRIIQIQPMLRLNIAYFAICKSKIFIQIQPMLRLNVLPKNPAIAADRYSNTTNVKVKC